MIEALEVVYGPTETTVRRVGFNPAHVVGYEYCADLTAEEQQQLGIKTANVLSVNFIDQTTRYLIGTPAQLGLAKAKKELLKS
jgi:hypothetical protein